MSNGVPLRVLIAALTFRRPDDLAALLPAVLLQAEGVPEAVELLIVDNDPGAGAEAQVGAFGRDVRYLHVPEPGIANARNGALDFADRAGHDVLVFIDDDERPSERWLEQLLAVWKAGRPGAVVGPVVSEFSVEPPAWILAGRFFDRRRLPTGTETDVAATNNLLLDMAAVRAIALRFDPRFGLTGGSDTLFTRSLHRAGARIVWCDEAVVTDVVPRSRLTRSWVLQRAYRSGNSDAMTALALDGAGIHLRTRGRFLRRGIVRTVTGGTALLLGSLTGRQPLQARGARTMARGRGMLGGVFGRAFEEYSRT